jgi:type IV pilus assembly protein PilZ
MLVRLGIAMADKIINYVVNELLELNLAYMPFIKDGGLFIMTTETYPLGERLVVDLQLPGKKDPLRIEGKVVCITPPNALHHVLPGVGIQFTGQNAAQSRTLIEANLDRKVDVGGYTYGITEGASKETKS